MNKLYFFSLVFLFSACKNEGREKPLEGKVERGQITIVTKVPGKVSEIRVQEGDFVHAGDTLVILDIPEVDAKAEQARGALQSAEAQYNMATKGATRGQLVQLQAKVDGLKEQFEFAEKSINRLKNLLADSLVSQQQYDETYAKYQGAKNQYLAAQAEIEEARNGARYEQQVMALGQKERALGAVAEVKIAAREKYLTAPQDMSVETINLNVGELATAGYAVVNGYINEATYFRFTVPENRVGKLNRGSEVTLRVPYLDNKEIKGKVVAMKALSSYANISTAYPDYDNQLSVFEIKVVPEDYTEVSDLLTKTLVVLQAP